MTLDDFPRDRAAIWTHARPRRTVVGCQGRLGAGARVRAAGRWCSGIVGSRVLASQRRRPEQRRLLVSAAGQSCLPRTARCGMAQRRYTLDFWLGARIVLAQLPAKAENDVSPRLEFLNENQIGTGDVHVSYAGSAAYLQLLWTALLSEQIMGRPDESHYLRSRKVCGLPSLHARSAP